jgi:ABC-type oligopeptide transport system ATPase subunit
MIEVKNLSKHFKIKKRKKRVTNLVKKPEPKNKMVLDSFGV